MISTSHANGQSITTPFRVLWERQSYTNMLYLLLSFPLGLLYFVFLVSGIALGLGTLVIWIGAFILIFMMSGWRQIAAFERSLAMHWLHITISPLSYPITIPMTRWQRIQTQLKNPLTWKTLSYLLLKFPFGIFSFVTTVVLLLLSIALAIPSLVIWLITAPFVVLFAIFKSSSHPKQLLLPYLSLAATGFGLGLLTFHILNSLASLAGQFAHVMLGMSSTAWRLEEVQVQAAQARERAEQADQRRRQLVVNVSHELRTPVASISGHLESLLMATEEGTTAPSPATLYNYLRIAHQEARRLGTLVDELLSLAHMESDELQLNIQEIVAREAVEEVYQMLSPLALRERQVTLVRGVAPHLPLVLADHQRLVQILLNLVRNAITSTPVGGIVSMNLEPANSQHLALVVADNGIGIPAKDLAYIFDRFYRGDTSRTRASGGLGLGLAIVHDLVTAMGGSISVESTIGQGSRFCVLLPIAPSPH